MTKKLIDISKLSLDDIAVWNETRDTVTFCDDTTPTNWTPEWCLVVDTVLCNQIVATRHNQTVDKDSNMLNALALRVTEGLLRKLFVLNEIVGIQPMSNPAQLVYILRGIEQTRTDNEKRLTFEVCVVVVTSVIQKLTSNFLNDTLNEVNSLFDLNMWSKSINILTTELFTKITNEILTKLLSVSGKVELGALPTNWASLPLIDRILTSFNVAAEQIKQNTQRGRGNFIIVSPVLSAAIQHQVKEYTSQTFEYEPILSAELMLPAPIHKTGLLWVWNTDKSQRVLLCTVFTTVAPQMVNDNTHTVLVGYKGVTAVDTGFVYCPYDMRVARYIAEDAFNIAIRHGMWTGDENSNTNPYYISYDVTIKENE